MSSVTVKQLKSLLENVPDDYEVIMEIGEGKGKKSIAMINGFRVVDDTKEARLMN